MSKIPTRFEHIQQSGLEFAPLLVPVEGDLQNIDRLRRAAKLQGGGLLSFLYGDSGCGKTTSVWSAHISASEFYRGVLAVPSSLPLRNVSEWLANNLPEPSDKTTIVLFDGREASDDTVGIRQLMASLNQILRSRSDVLCCWPTTNEEWQSELVDVARKVGGTSLVPKRGVIKVSGPPRDEWMNILDRVLIQLDQRLEDLGLTQEGVTSFCDEADTVGEFLGMVRDVMAERVEEVQLAKNLPQILFIITSMSAVVGESNRLRRAGNFVLKAEELISYSPRSESGKWWKERNKDPRHHLAYVISLFQSRLTTMTPSPVVHALLEFGPEDISRQVSDAGVARNVSNSDRAMKGTDFYRHLAGIQTTELTSTTKGKTSDSVKNAYTAIQGMSAKRHKVINQSICSLAERNLPTFLASSGRFEVDLGESDAFADAVIMNNGEEFHLEFHHLSEPHCKAASMSAYIMDKLRTYAIRYQIVPR